MEAKSDIKNVSKINGGSTRRKHAALLMEPCWHEYPQPIDQMLPGLEGNRNHHVAFNENIDSASLAIAK